MIRVELPYHLRNLAGIGREVAIEAGEVGGGTPVTIAAVLDAIEAQYPMLLGTIRDASTRQRRPFIRFFACGQDLSHDPTDAALPAEVVAGKEPLRIVGAMAGG